MEALFDEEILGSGFTMEERTRILVGRQLIRFTFLAYRANNSFVNIGVYASLDDRGKTIFATLFEGRKRLVLCFPPSPLPYHIALSLLSFCDI